jgi:hypothetical protein
MIAFVVQVLGMVNIPLTKIVEYNSAVYEEQN